METNNQYFDIVTNRIKELKEQIKSIQTEIKQYQIYSKDNSRLIQSYRLQIEFLNKTIYYLEQLKDLPLYYIIEQLPNYHLEIIQKHLKKESYTLEDMRFYLIQILHLQIVPSLIEQISNPYSIHLDMNTVYDFEVLIKLLQHKSRYQEIERKKQSIKNEWIVEGDLPFMPKEGSKISFNYSELSLLEQTSNTFLHQLDEILDQFYGNYSPYILRKIRFYRRNIETTHLSKEFIQMHQNKVCDKMPSMKKSIKRFFIARRFHFFPNFLFKNIKEQEKIFLEGVINFYKNNTICSDLGIPSIDFLEICEEDFYKRKSQIENAAEKRKKQIIALKLHIQTSETSILRSIKEYEQLQEKEKQKFSKKVEANVSSMKELWPKWLWEKPNLKNYFLQAYITQELHSIFNALSKYENKEIYEQFVLRMK